MFDWIAIVKILLTLASSAYSAYERSKAVQEGDDRAVLRMLLEMQKRNLAYRAIEARVDKMTPAEVIAELDKQGDFRD